MLGLFRQPPASPRPRLARPAAEALEERSVPAVFTVTNRSDHNPGSLRVAVQNANTTPGPDTVRFAPAFDATITLTTGEIDIADDLTIQGLGANRCVVSGNNSSRIFNLADAPGPVDVSISGLKLTRARVDGDNGGALYAGDSTLTVRNCVISGNAAVNDGGDGPAIAAGGASVTAVNTIFANNFSDGGGGALYLGGTRLTARNCQFLNNTARNDDGGALYLADCVTTLSGCVIRGNTARDDGGGISFNGGTLTVKNSTVAQNTAEFGGGVSGFEGGGRLTVSSSTISGNRANGDVDTAVSRGGAGLILRDVQALIVNSTVSGNVDQSANTVDYTGGGGLHLYGGNTVVRNSTIAFNSTVGRGGGIFLRDSDAGPGRLVLASTIVSNSAAPGGNLDVARAAGEGQVTAAFSLVQRVQPGFVNNGSQGNQFGVNPRLLPLADNGGPTRTHAFTAGSPARDAGSNPGQLQFDQRGPGFPRVKGVGVDVGSLELF